MTNGTPAERPIADVQADTAQWFVVATRPRMETEARKHLQRQGYAVCLPEISLRKRRRGQWTAVIEPLFPGYLFIELTLGVDDPAPIRSTVGCRTLVRSGADYVPVPPAVMAPLLDFGKAPATPESTFKPGDKVTIESGPFQGLPAIFKMAKGSDRAEVLIALLGSARPVVIEQNSLSSDT